MFLTAVPKPIATRIHRIGNTSGVLLNIEDDRARSDFHFAAVIRRGDLTLAISTNGKSPGFAAALRRLLEAQFGPEWQDLLDRIAALRVDWQQAGIDPASVARRTTTWLTTVRDPSHIFEAPARRLLREANWES